MHSGNLAVYQVWHPWLDSAERGNDNLAQLTPVGLKQLVPAQLLTCWLYLARLA